jgi:hypothetical protein
VARFIENKMDKEIKERDGESIKVFGYRRQP